MVSPMDSIRSLDHTRKCSRYHSKLPHGRVIPRFYMGLAKRGQVVCFVCTAAPSNKEPQAKLKQRAEGLSESQFSVYLGTWDTLRPDSCQCARMVSCSANGFRQPCHKPSEPSYKSSRAW